MTINTFNWRVLIAVIFSMALSTANAAGTEIHEDDTHDHRMEARSNHDDHGESDEHHDEKEEEHGDEHGDRVELSDEQVAASGITTTKIGSGTLRQTIPVYGRIKPDPAQVATISARYPGLISRLNFTVGDTVERGQKLLTIEASDSLQPYTMRAPISGVVLKRLANVGEQISDQPVLVIADYSKLWVQLAIFPKQASNIAVGQPVTVYGDSAETEGTIDWIAPAAHTGPAVEARVVMDNPDGRWVVGSQVRAAIGISTVDLPLVVDNRALQSTEGLPTVFVREGQAFEARRPQLGRSDGRITEVLAGLESGDEVVVINSYLLKAELEKSSASHDH